MDVRDALRLSGIDQLDAEVLLGAVLNKNRAWLLGHPEYELSVTEEEKFTPLARRRKKGEPAAYILGYREFYGRRFTVTPATLIPRPSTETLVEETIAYFKNAWDKEVEADSGISVITKVLRNRQPEMIVDIGTGSGCIPITLALEGCMLPLVGVDISEEALKVALKNKTDLAWNYNIEFARVDGIEHIRNLSVPFLLVSNPPYIPEDEELDETVSDFEPYQALFAGEDGLSVIKPMLIEAKINSNCVGFILELRTDQLPEIEEFL